jgi:anti-anti-sigma factor
LYIFTIYRFTIYDLIGLKIILHLREFFIGLLDLHTQAAFIDIQALSQFGIVERYHLNSEDGSVLGTIHTDRCHRDAWRHLDDREQGVETIEIECADLSYLSSAGLRVLMMMRKALPTAPIVLTNVRPNVVEVLDMSGLIDYLEVR